jgi:hypothetical protein
VTVSVVVVVMMITGIVIVRRIMVVHRQPHDWKSFA